MSLSQQKILVLIKSLGLGGAERLIVDSLPYLDREWFDYTFAYFLPWKDFLVPQFVETGFSVHCLGGLSAKDDPSTSLRTSGRISKGAQVTKDFETRKLGKLKKREIGFWSMSPAIFSCFFVNFGLSCFSFAAVLNYSPLN